MTSQSTLLVRRRPNRMAGYDYATQGAYFITICTHEHRTLLDVQAVRDMIEHWWMELERKYPCVETDAFVIMPNHVHGIIAITEPRDVATATTTTVTNRCAERRVSLPTMVQWFKTMTTNEYIRGVRHDGWKPFEGHLWQRSYWDHIIRNDGDLERLRTYIKTNPIRWREDTLFS